MAFEDRLVRGGINKATVTDGDRSIWIDGYLRGLERSLDGGAHDAG